MSQGMQQEAGLYAQIDYLLRNRIASDALVVIGTGAATKVKITNATFFYVNGVKVATALSAGAESFPALPANYGRGNASDVGAAAQLPGVRFDLALASPSQAFPTVLATIPVSSWQRYLVVCDSTGTVYTLPSPIGLASASAAPDAPPVPNGYVVLGDVTVKTDSTHTFIPGTTAFNAAGITSVFRDHIWPDTGLSAIREARTGWLV